ncbi:MAG TPA: cytochrome P460 family protein [Candidatus Acidoferrum sp.]|nr:cytochrome P460 family protein [Candidatus Acidoferrum sp.]
MRTTLSGVVTIIALVLAVLGGRSSSARQKQDKYTLQVPGGLAFSEIKGYEQWQVVGPSLTEAANVIRVIVANPVMIKAYEEGIPGNGKPFPDGSKIVKLEWRPKKITDPPFSASTPDTVAGDLVEVEFIVKNSKKFSDAHGWGFAMFDHDAAAAFGRNADAGLGGADRGRFERAFFFRAQLRAYGIHGDIDMD